MTTEEFIEVLEEKRYYSYKIEGDKVVVTHKGDVWLNSLTSLPSGVEFKNVGSVHLGSLTSLPPGVEFMNRGVVHLNSLTNISPVVKFKNRGNVFLNSLKKLPLGVEFSNRGYAFLESTGIKYFDAWSGNIEGIAPNRLLNMMISKGVFER